MKINRNFDNLVPNYLFADVAKKTNAYIAAHPDKKVIKLGIGDVTLPLAPVVVEAMKRVQRILLTRKLSRVIPIMRATSFSDRLFQIITRALVLQ